MDLKEKLIDSKEIYKGYKLSLKIDHLQCMNNVVALKEVVLRANGIAVLPILNNGNVLLEKEYRHPFNDVLIACPAGKLDKGETFLEGAKRELEEETGYKAEKFIKIAEIYPAPAYSTEVCTLYLAKDLTLGVKHEDKDEFIETFEVSLKEFKELVDNGQIKDGKTVFIKTWMEKEGYFN